MDIRVYLFSATTLKQALGYAAFSIEPKRKTGFLHHTAKNPTSQIMWVYVQVVILKSKENVVQLSPDLFIKHLMK